MAGRRLLVVAGGTRSTASTRHRVWHYRPFLEADGVRLTWVEYAGGRVPSARRAALLRLRFLRDLAGTLRPFDAVLVQKVLPPPLLVRAWKALGARVVYDFDDALFAPSVVGESPRREARRRRRFRAMVRAADGVVAGSPPLAEHARELGPPVRVLYPALDRRRFRDLRPPPRDPERPVIGWIGNDQSQVYLRELVPVLEDLFRRRPGARLLVCTSRPPDLGAAVGARTDFVPWSEEAEVASVAAFDVAVSPLASDPWSRARGGRVSVLLSLAAGVPAVVSPGGGLEELARSGGGDPSAGLLFAGDGAEWRDHLERLCDSPDERRRRGEAARALVDREIWADVQYPRFREAVLGV